MQRRLIAARCRLLKTSLVLLGARCAMHFFQIKNEEDTPVSDGDNYRFCGLREKQIHTQHARRDSRKIVLTLGVLIRAWGALLATHRRDKRYSPFRGKATIIL